MAAGVAGDRSGSWRDRRPRARWDAPRRARRGRDRAAVLGAATAADLRHLARSDADGPLAQRATAAHGPRPPRDRTREPIGRRGAGRAIRREIRRRRDPWLVVARRRRRGPCPRGRRPRGRRRRDRAGRSAWPGAKSRARRGRARRHDRRPRDTAGDRSLPVPDPQDLGSVPHSGAVRVRRLRLRCAHHGGRWRPGRRRHGDRARARRGDGARRRDGRSSQAPFGNDTRMIYPVYSALVATALVAGYGPAAVARYLAHGVPLNLRERLGYTGRETARMPHGWLHAVSVGEAIAAAPIVAGVRGLYPDLPLVMTTVTATGAHVVRERYRADVEHRYLPLDLPGAVRRVTATIDPAFLILMETELWPNLLRHLCRLEVPVMVANGRLSDRSFPRYRLARPFVQKVLDCVTVFAMQSEEDARRAVALGARPDRVFVTGNVKADAVADQTGSKERWRGLLGLAPAQRAWVAGSTHAGEEDALLDAHAVLRREVSDLVLVLAPRHPERVSDVLRRIAARGWDAVRRSELPRPKAADTVIVLDT